MTNGTGGIRFFAAANSARGFVSLFEEIFGGLSKLYIIKGGSGTGKSRMMEEIAAAAERRGHAVERYYCSADHASLDGVVIPALDFGIMDGTAPHTRDPKFPGAVDEIVNVGAFWDGALLRESAGEIKELMRQKALYFNCAFDSLGAAGNYRRAAGSLRERALDREKAGRAARRIVSRLHGGGEPRLICRVLDCYGMRGEHRFDTFARAAGEVVPLTGRHRGAPLFLGSLKKAALEAGHTVYAALDPLTMEEIVELYLPDAGVAFVRPDGGGATGQPINTDRFVDPNELREVRPTLTQLKRQERGAIGCALDMLAKAAENHFRLEQIYSRAMDFKAKEKLTREIIEGLF